MKLEKVLGNYKIMFYNFWFVTQFAIYLYLKQYILNCLKMFYYYKKTCLITNIFLEQFLKIHYYF